MRKLKCLLKNVGIALVTMFFVLVVGFLMAETLVRVISPMEKATGWHDPNTAFDSEIGWSPIPNGRLQNEWGNISSNSLGFRSDELVSSKEHIVLLGDSVTWGYGMDDKFVASYILQQKVDPSVYQVVNMGVSGYSVDQYFLFLKRHLDSLTPLSQLILVIHASHDLTETGRNAMYGKSKPLFRMMKGELKLTKSRLHKYSVQNLISMSHFIHRLLVKWPALHPVFFEWAGGQSLERTEREQVVSQLIRKMKKLVESKGGAFKIVLSPATKEFYVPSADYIWFQRECEEMKYACMDFADKLKAASGQPRSLYIDAHHYTETGNQLLAESLYEHLELEA